MKRRKGALYWRKRLRRLNVSRLSFKGGKLKISRQQLREGGGIQGLGKDHVAITAGDLLYYIPYNAILRVRGKRRKHRRPVDRKCTLYSEVKEWIDPEVDPETADFFWYSFVSRRCRWYAGEIKQVKKGCGVLLGLKGHRTRWIHWKYLGAATELQE